MFYGQPPDFFDDWKYHEVTREMKILGHIMESRNHPLTKYALADMLAMLFPG